MHRHDRGAGAEVGVSNECVQLSASFDQPGANLIQSPGQLVGKYISIVAQGKLLVVEGCWLSALVGRTPHYHRGAVPYAQAHLPGDAGGAVYPADQ